MNLLVISETNLPELKLLDQLPSSLNITISNNLQELETLALTTDIILLCRWSGNKDILSQILDINPRIKWVHTWWTGVDSIISPELKKHPLTLTNAKGVYAEPLAEFVIGSCIYFAKDFPRIIKNQKEGLWEQYESELIQGKTLGIFGYGKIGECVAKKANALGMNVIAVRKRKELSTKDPYLKQLLSFDEADELFKNSDYVVCSAPLTEETKHFINKTKFDLMKSNAVFMNIGRGPVVKELDLVEALRSKKIRGAALDVFEVEPLDKNSPLWAMENVLISPHIADRNSGWLENSMQFFVDNCLKFIKGQALDNIVDLELGY